MWPFPSVPRELGSSHPRSSDDAAQKLGKKKTETGFGSGATLEATGELGGRALRLETKRLSNITDATEKEILENNVQRQVRGMTL